MTLSDLPHFPCSSQLRSAAVNGALNKAHYPAAQPPKTEVPLGLPLGAGEGVHYGSSARSSRRREGASITALGDVMSRWPGATQGPVPPCNNPSFHPRPTSALRRPRSGGHTGLVKRRGGGGGGSGGPGDVSLTSQTFILAGRRHRVKDGGEEPRSRKGALCHQKL